MLAALGAFVLISAYGALARPLAEPRPQLGGLLPGAPSVTTRNGTVVGSSLLGIDTFKGIPFAEPPVGNLRLRPPQPLSKGYGTKQATAIPTACPQMSELGGVMPSMPATPNGEDCLTLNIQRPSNTSTDHPLPVLFWIFGGGFEFGSTQMYDASPIIQASMQYGQPIVYVAINYRLNGFGWLAGKELQKEGATNLGLRDQRMALEWVAENIAAFGGDPSRVTLWGESAGAISVYDQLLVNRGDNTYHGKPLFRGAIMDSGSAIPVLDVASPKPQSVYNQVVQSAGCSDKKDTVACLRSLPYDQFNAAVCSVPALGGYRSVDESYFPRPDPTDGFLPLNPEDVQYSNSIARVPFIIGDQEDEGTEFVGQLVNVTDTQKLVDYLQTYYPFAPRPIVQGLVDQYPTDPAAGSPFHTGLLYETYPGYKRNAAIIGDFSFTLQRRMFLEKSRLTSPFTPCWSYLATYLRGTSELGTFHASDITEDYTLLPLPEPGMAAMLYYISFVNHLDPNTIKAPFLIPWPQWDEFGRQLMDYGATGNSLTPDTFRQNAYEYLSANIDILQI